MYRTFKIALATALLATTTLAAEAGRLPGPSTSAAGGIDAITTGEIDSPGDPFRPQVDVPRVGTETYVMRCWVDDDETFSNGNAIIILKNTSTKTIPKGSSIVVVYPDGTKETVVAFVDILPGGAMGVQGPPDTTACKASASSAVLPPEVSDGPTGNPAIPNP